MSTARNIPSDRGLTLRMFSTGLMLVMLGAIQKKILVWHTGFWGKSATNGWSYDLMLVAMCLVIATTGGGDLGLQVLWRR